MNILNKVLNCFKARKQMKLMDLTDWGLVIYGVPCFLVAGYYGLILSDIVPGFVKEVNETEISFVAILVGILLGLLGLQVWVFGCIAARCHTLLYDRWFQ